MSYPKTLVRKTVGRKRHRLGLSHTSLFATPLSAEEISREQVERFNRTWAHALTLPFYRKLAADHGLPGTISELADFSRWPVLRKDDFRRHEDLMWAGLDRGSVYSTSGTTSDPFHFPCGEKDFAAIYAAMWSYRSAAGLEPFDSFAAVGNLHTGTVNSRGPLALSVARRHLKDLLGNSWKINAMYRDPDYLDRELRRLVKMRPAYVIGYTTAVEALARRAAETGILRNRGYVPRCAILSSEYISAESARAVSEGLKTTVLSEYGSRETGVIAASTTTDIWPMRTVWHNCILQADQDGMARVTTIDGRAFPLINYEIGDLISPQKTGPGGTILELGPIRGRAADVLRLPDRKGVIQTYPAMGLADTVVYEPDVEGIQVVQHDNTATLLVLAPQIDRQEYLTRASASLRAAYPNLAPGTVRLALIDDMIAGPRGKRQLMVREGVFPAGRWGSVPLN